MLSIGTLSAGQAKYYLDQAQGRVDAVESIGDGVEEYYVGGTEARGEWLGAAAGELGLEGPVAGAALRRVLSGLDPLDGSALRGSSSPTRSLEYAVVYTGRLSTLPTSKQRLGQQSVCVHGRIGTSPTWPVF